MSKEKTPRFLPVAPKRLFAHDACMPLMHAAPAKYQMEKTNRITLQDVTSVARSKPRRVVNRAGRVGTGKSGWFGSSIWESHRSDPGIVRC